MLSTVRVLHSVFVTLFAGIAVLCPRSAQSQVLSPFRVPPDYDQHLDRVVPVATVSPLGQVITLAGAQQVDVAFESFILGSATLDLHDPLRANVVFTMTNASETPILRNRVVIEEYSVVLRSDERRFMFPGIGGLLESSNGRRQLNAAWEPRQTITVQIPISPVPRDSTLLAFLVMVQTADTPRRADRDEPLLRSAFERLRSQTHR